MTKKRLGACTSGIVVVLVGVLILAMSAITAAQERQEPIQYVVHANDLQLATYEAKSLPSSRKQRAIPVEIITTTGGQKGKWERIITLIAGGVSPDVVGGVSTEFGEFAVKGILRPLDDLISRSNVDMDALIPPLYEALQFQGEQYLLPYGGSVLTMFYNIHHFDRAGLNYPPKEWGTIDWTYDTFVDYAKKLTLREADGRTSQYGVAGYFWDSWITLPYPWGGRWVSDDLRRFEGTSPQAVASLQAFQDLIYQDEVMPAGGGLGRFTSGTGSMAGLGTWNLVALGESTEEWDFMPWFRVQETAQAAINPVGYGILSTSKNVDAAWELIRWLTWNEKANWSMRPPLVPFRRFKATWPTGVITGNGRSDDRSRLTWSFSRRHFTEASFKSVSPRPSGRSTTLCRRWRPT